MRRFIGKKEKARGDVTRTRKIDGWADSVSSEREKRERDGRGKIDH